jgi:hypothetical protein
MIEDRKILFFDTVSSGEYCNKIPIYHKDQPHLMKLYVLLTNYLGMTINYAEMIVKPIYGVRYSVDPLRNEAYLYTWDLCEKMGVEAELVMDLFGDMCRKADIVVTYGMKLKRKLMKTFFARNYVFDLIEGKETFCIGEETRKIMEVKRIPKVSECYRFYFDTGTEIPSVSMIVIYKNMYMKMREIAKGGK